MEFDNALKCIGEFGLYQKKFYLLLNFAVMPLSAQLLVLVFVAAPPTWICLDLNSPTTGVRQCSANGSVCSKAVYTSESTTIGTEWHLVCADSYKNELAQSVFMLGTMIGAPVCGNAADKYGRKELWMVVITMSTFWGFLSCFSPNYYLFLIFRFFVGVFVGGGILVTFVLATEMVGPTKRGMAGTLTHMFGTIKLLILALLAYYIRDWRALILATVLPGIFVVFTFSMIPESPRWLLSEGRVKEAEEIMKDAALINGVTISKPIRLKTHLKGKGHSKHEVKDLFKHRTLCAITIALMFIWFTCSLVYYGISLNLKNLGGDIYTNFAIAASVEFPAYFCTIFFISWSGRRKSLFIFLLGTATSCWCCMKYTYSENTFTMTTLAATGKFFITATFAVIYVFSAELFPTVIRNLGMGVVSFTNRMGGVLAPFVVLMGEYDRSLPMLVFAVLASMAAVISISLPETNCKALPETVEDCEIMFNNKKTSKTGLIRTLKC